MAPRDGNRPNLQEKDLAGLADLCLNVARNLSDDKLSETAHALRVEWVRLSLRPRDDGKLEADKESLRKRMTEFLSGVPTWML
jgi:hypothetical protein